MEAFLLELCFPSSAPPSFSLSSYCLILGLFIFSHLLQEEASPVMDKSDTEIWVQQNIFRSHFIDAFPYKFPLKCSVILDASYLIPALNLISSLPSYPTRMFSYLCIFPCQGGQYVFASPFPNVYPYWVIYCNLIISDLMVNG